MIIYMISDSHAKSAKLCAVPQKSVMNNAPQRLQHVVVFNESAEMVKVLIRKFKAHQRSTAPYVVVGPIRRPW